MFGAMKVSLTICLIASFTSGYAAERAVKYYPRAGKPFSQAVLIGESGQLV